ncbi:alpha/beta hydrolase [Williamsia sp. Leaf354]|jgi:diacylglycerol O-acyltransferase/trehalose O-mycolyltransferase|uniref:alpha/beta hydrolase n=1 Tax=Williamsia sp. Leaf354 TaxID=1736349 RepID=UPI000AF8661D|nr:alpha/beta hydrolase family protein [Williamsia sp. Leaf354]
MAWIPTDHFPAPDSTGAATRPAWLRPAVLRPVAIVLAVCVVLFALAALLVSNNKAGALIGHPEKLRPGCTWDSSGNYVQNCKVWSPSNNRWVIVQIRASNTSTQGVYLLDGMRARDDRSAWTTDVQAAKVYDGKSDTTLVMPVGGASSFYTDWNGGAGAANTPIKQETFLTSELPDYLNREFGVAKSGNAIVGLSMSAGPAVTLAEKHPEQFKVVQAMSGYYQTNNPLGALGVFATQTMVSNYTNGILNMWGAPGSAQWQQNDASQNLAKLKENGQVLIVSSGNAFLSPSEMRKLKPADQISAILLEALSAVSTILFQLQAAQAGVSVITIPNYGGHDWENWNRALQAGKTNVIDAMKAAPPVTNKTMVLNAARIASAPSSSESSSAASTTSSSSSSSAAPSASSSSSSAAASSSSTSPSSSDASVSTTPSAAPAPSNTSAPASAAASTPVCASVDPSATVAANTSAVPTCAPVN